jgi:hypothetical protein
MGGLLQRSEKLGPDRDHADEKGNRGQCSGFSNDGAKHDVLPERRQNIVHVMFLCQAAPANIGDRSAMLTWSWCIAALVGIRAPMADWKWYTALLLVVAVGISAYAYLVSDLMTRSH